MAGQQGARSLGRVERRLIINDIGAHAQARVLQYCDDVASDMSAMTIDKPGGRSFVQQHLQKIICTAPCRDRCKPVALSLLCGGVTHTIGGGSRFGPGPGDRVA